MLRMAGVPFIVHEGEGRPDIERIEADGHLLDQAVWIAECLSPIENVIDLHTAVRDHFGGASCGRGQRRHQELGVISNQPMASLPGAREPQLEGFPWSLAESHMRRRIVN